MSESEKLVDIADRIIEDLVLAHGFAAIGAILGSAAALAVVNGREPYLREVLALLNVTIDQMVEHRKASAQ
jgi:hypothetical protein